MNIFDAEKLKFQTNSNIIISGASGSGKTEIIKKLIKHQREIFNRPHKSIVYYYGIYTPSINEIEEMGGITKVGMPEINELKKFERPSLIILDDLLPEISNAAGEAVINDLFTRQSHHNDSTICLVTQSLYRMPSVARQSAHVFFLTAAVTSIPSVKILANQLFGGSPLRKCLVDAMEDIRKKKFSYLVVDVHPETDTHFSIKNGIFPDENFIIYMP